MDAQSKLKLRCSQAQFKVMVLDAEMVRRVPGEELSGATLIA